MEDQAINSTFITVLSDRREPQPIIVNTANIAYIEERPGGKAVIFFNHAAGDNSHSLYVAQSLQELRQLLGAD